MCNGVGVCEACDAGRYDDNDAISLCLGGPCVMQWRILCLGRCRVLCWVDYTGRACRTRSLIKVTFQVVDSGNSMSQTHDTTYEHHTNVLRKVHVPRPAVSRQPWLQSLRQCVHRTHTHQQQQLHKPAKSVTPSPPRPSSPPQQPAAAAAHRQHHQACPSPHSHP